MFLFLNSRASLPKVISIPANLGFGDSLPSFGISALAAGGATSATAGTSAVHSANTHHPTSSPLDVTDALDVPDSSQLDDTLPSSTQGFNPEPVKQTTHFTIARYASLIVV